MCVCARVCMCVHWIAHDWQSLLHRAPTPALCKHVRGYVAGISGTLRLAELYLSQSPPTKHLCLHLLAATSLLYSLTTIVTLDAAFGLIM